MKTQKVTKGSELLQQWLDDGHTSMTALARAMGVTRQSVSLWALGHTMPSRDNARALEQATDGDVPASSW